LPIEWSELIARRLFWGAAALSGVCAGVIAARLAGRFGGWRAPDLGAPGAVALWVVLAVSILLGMDRGIPRHGVWAHRLLWMRRALLLAALATVGVLTAAR
jgi:hypothetical protein